MPGLFAGMTRPSYHGRVPRTTGSVRPAFATAALLAALMLFPVSPAPPAQSQPMLPATFFGTATIDGQNVPDGTPVIAWIDGLDCTQADSAARGTVTEGGVSSYAVMVVHESQRPGCGAEGRDITFTIGGRQAHQSAPWQPGVHHLDLNAGEGEPIPLPTATPTSAADATAAAATATELARYTPLPAGTPPLDDLRGAPGAANSGSGNLLLWAGSLLAIVVGLGALAGLLLSRRMARRDA